MLDKTNVLPPPSTAEPARAQGQDLTRRDFSEWVKPASDQNQQVPDDIAAIPVEVSHASLGEEFPMIASSVHSIWMQGILYGWQLASQPGMSQLGGIAPGSEASVGGRSNGNDGSSSRGASGVPDRADVLPGSLPQAGSTNTMGLSQGASSVSLAMSMRSAAVDGLDTASLTALMAWSERSLRRVTTPEGQTTVWLRDYRIGEDEIPALVNHLLGQHENRGSLHRIMINGVEVWRQDTYSSLEQR